MLGSAPFPTQSSSGNLVEDNRGGGGGGGRAHFWVYVNRNAKSSHFAVAGLRACNRIGVSVSTL